VGAHERRARRVGAALRGHGGDVLPLPRGVWDDEAWELATLILEQAWQVTMMQPDIEDDRAVGARMDPHRRCARRGGHVAGALLRGNRHLVWVR
jgi:hypothetical protein